MTTHFITDSTLFKLRREGSKELLGIILEQDTYERKYQLIEAAYAKILEVGVDMNNQVKISTFLSNYISLQQILYDTQQILTTQKFDPAADKFPTEDTQLVNAITVTLENACIFGEIMIHNPDISYRILESRKNKHKSYWKDLINWSIKYTRYFNDRIIDAKSQELLSLVEQEINPELRTANFINPYRDVNSKPEKLKTKKVLKKGPQMVQRDEF